MYLEESFWRHLVPPTVWDYMHHPIDSEFLRRIGRTVR